jgi:hypothetical protein
MGAMLRLYCLPGKLVAELGFLFPGRGQIWGSARRRESRLAHFLYATAFYAFLFFLIAGRVDGGRRPTRPTAVPAQASLLETSSPPALPVENEARIQETTEPEEERPAYEAAPTASAEPDYPTCSDTVTDRCIQK